MTPILLLHGALGSASQFQSLAREFTSEGLTPLTMDFSGHGRKPFGVRFGIEAFADDVLHFLDEHQIDTTHCFGYSMGGYVALWCALHHPDRFMSIVTLGTKYDWSPQSAEREIKKLDPEKIIAKVPAFARILESRHGDWNELIARTAEMMEGLGSRPLLTLERLSGVKNRVLVALGDNDDMADRTFSREVAAAMPLAEFRLLTETLHALEKTDTRALAGMISGFCKS